MNNFVLRKVEPGVDIAQEVAGKLTSTFEISVIEEIEEILDEVAEQCINKSMSDSRFDLCEAFVVLDLAVVVFIRLLRVIFDAIIQLLTKVLWSTFLKFTKPSFNVFHSFINNILKGHLRPNQIVDGTHKEREDADSHKFDDHLKGVLNWRISFEITVAYCCQSGNDPVKGDGIDLPPFLIVDFNLTVPLTIIEPAAVGYWAYIDPEAAEQVDGGEQIDDQVYAITRFLYTALVQTRFGKNDPNQVRQGSIDLSTVPKSDHFEPKYAFVTILALVHNECGQSCSHIEDHGAFGIIFEYLHEGDDPGRILLESSNKLQRYIDGHQDIHHYFVAHAGVNFLWERFSTVWFENLITGLST